MIKKLIQKYPLKKTANQGQAEKYFKNLALEVAKILGHKTKTGDFSAATSIRRYIDPGVGINFFKTRNLRTPNFLQFAE